MNNNYMYWASTEGNLLLYSRIDDTNVPFKILHNKSVHYPMVIMMTLLFKFNLAWR